MGPTIAAAGLLMLAVAHSAAGESGVIRPLLAADWAIADIPRWAADRLIRGAWHLTSLAWLGLAAIVLDASALTTVGLVALGSGIPMLIALRPHFAWPIFLISGLAALRADGMLPDSVVWAGGAMAAGVLVMLSLLHVYWAFGGRRGLDAALPAPAEGATAFTPGPMLTLAVAALLFALAALVGARLAGIDHWTVTTAVAAGAAVLAVRAAGDGRQAGFSKTDRSSTFAKADDRYFTPLVVLLSFGTVGSLLI